MIASTLTRHYQYSRTTMERKIKWIHYIYTRVREVIAHCIVDRITSSNQHNSCSTKRLANGVCLQFNEIRTSSSWTATDGRRFSRIKDPLQVVARLLRYTVGNPNPTERYCFYMVFQSWLAKYNGQHAWLYCPFAATTGGMTSIREVYKQVCYHG